MELKIQIVAVVASAMLLFSVLELVRQRRLLERYALLWLFSALVLIALAVWGDLLQTVANVIGVVYPPSALFVIAFGFILVLLLHFSVAVSRLADQSKVLAQRLALLEERLRGVEGGQAGAEAGEQAESSPRSPAASASEGEPFESALERAGRR